MSKSELERRTILQSLISFQDEQTTPPCHEQVTLITDYTSDLRSEVRGVCVNTIELWVLSAVGRLGLSSSGLQHTQHPAGNKAAGLRQLTPPAPLLRGARAAIVSRPQTNRAKLPPRDDVGAPFDGVVTSYRTALSKSKPSSFRYSLLPYAASWGPVPLLAEALDARAFARLRAAAAGWRPRDNPLTLLPRRACGIRRLPQALRTMDSFMAECCLCLWSSRSSALMRKPGRN